ncbi:MAG: hypothetical protein KGD60_07170 [Candidatus Thorarchaeota archaeon]|nr:hypothetical protein [Candidatus Thorarchaeota archaeon]
MKRINTVLIVALLVLSFAVTASFVSAQTTGDPFLYVAWDVTEEQDTFEHTEEHSQWVFGPQPTVEISYADNGTSIAENYYRVERNVDLLVDITIPKSFLGEGVNLDVVHFWASTGEDGGTFFVLEYNVTSDEWNKLNFHAAAGVDAPVSSDFVSLDTDSSEFNDNTGLNRYEVTFAFRFTLRIVRGVFWSGMQAIDTLGRPATPSWLASVNAGGFAVPPLGLGIDIASHVFELPQYYYAEVTDGAGDILHYVDVGDEFTLNLEANEALGAAVLPFATTYGKYTKDYDFSMPVNFFSPVTPWIHATEMPMVLFFVYNGTHAYPIAGYLDSISWTWSPEILQWVVDFDFLYNASIDVSEFYVPSGTTIENGGAKITWTGSFTDQLDLDMDDYKVGGKITPEPSFWFVINQDSDRLQPHPDIEKHNTVSLAFQQEFIEAFVRKDGLIADRAVQGDILNLTLNIHAPESLVNGTSYIEMNDFNVTAGEALEIDIGGMYYHVHRQNITVWLETEGFESNATHYWRHTTRHFIFVDFELDIAWSVSTVTKYVHTLDGVFVNIEVDLDVGLILVHDWSWTIGATESILDIGLEFSAEAPSMVVSSAHIASGGLGWWQTNLSLAGLNTWELYPAGPEPGNNTASFNEEVASDVIWSPSHFILGEVDFYEPQRWVITSDGAIDLDGNVFTTDDQYFIKRTGYWHDWGNTSVEKMEVRVAFEPTPGRDGDEYWSASWMGVIQLEMEFEANETFYWFHTDMSPVNQSELSDIRDQVWADNVADIAAPEYKYVSWMTENRTIDLSGITGLDSNTWTNTWFFWGTHQAFMVSVSDSSRLAAHFRAQYAGLLIFNDDPLGASPMAPDFYFEDGQLVTDEVSHLVLIDSIGSIEFRQPFGATNGTGAVIVSPDTEVAFGVSIFDVDVTIYPLQIEHTRGVRGPWAFRESYEGAIDLNQNDFDYAISHATVDEMAFDISFNVDQVIYDPLDATKWNHAVSFKIDQKIGDFTLDRFDQSVLDERSLAVNFFGVLGTTGRTQHAVGDRPVTDTNADSTGADYYQFGSAGSPYANVTMGGLPYTWGGDGHSTVYTSGSSTVPIGAFSAMYQSTSGQSVTDWRVDASMLFMTSGYEHWGGHEIICDPVFVAYTSAYQSTGPTTPFTPGGGNPLTLYLMVGGVVALVVVVCMLYRRR